MQRRLTPSPSQVCGAVAGQTVHSDAPRRDPLHRPVLGPQLRTQGPDHPNRRGLLLRAVTTRGRLPRRGVRRHDSILASKFRSLQALRTHRWGQRPFLMAGSVDHSAHGTRRVGAGLTDAPCLHAGCSALPGGANRCSGEGGCARMVGAGPSCLTRPGADALPVTAARAVSAGTTTRIAAPAPSPGIRRWPVTLCTVHGEDDPRYVPRR